MSGLKALLDACSANPKPCRSGGRIDHLAERKFRKAGFRRIESVFLMKILRKCLDEVDGCDVEKTIKVMEDMEKSVSKRKLYSRVRSKSLSKNIIADLKMHYPELLGRDSSSPLFSRHGRKYFASNTISRVKRSTDMQTRGGRQKRSLIASALFTLARETYRGPAVSSTKRGNGTPKDAQE